MPPASSALATPASTSSSAAKAWLRALELTAPIAKNPNRILSNVIEDAAERSPEAAALLSDRECLTYHTLAGRSNQYTRWALAQGLAKGDVIALMMPNRPEYLAIWLGLTHAGCVVALINTSHTGSSLSHSLSLVQPKHIIGAAELLGPLVAALSGSAAAAQIWVYGSGATGFNRLDLDIDRYPREKLSGRERRPVTIEDRALYIYTSGTTGLPKAVNVSHARLMQWSHWFAGMMQTDASDRLYNCLPMYHSVGGVLATGAVLVTGGSVVLREAFSARQFWNDIVLWDCTLFQYIGELCRYLLQTGTNLLETEHRLRMCCGNGLRPDIWSDFQSRFRIPKILEFYASTEGNVSIFNVEGKPGSIGRIPPYLAHRFPAKLVRFDVENGEPLRDERGFCIPCAVNEAGEAIGRIFADSSNTGTRFEGYNSEEASLKKVLRNVFDSGDAWFRTGDLMRKDEKGYFYFVDRIGDTFRWKGENVASCEVADIICAFPGIRQANVYGAVVPGFEGRAGMAAVAAGEELDLTAFRKHLSNHLPEYAHPLFLRLRQELEITGTFKVTKHAFAREGFDPAAISDRIYFNDRAGGAFIPLTTDLYGCIITGQVRL